MDGATASAVGRAIGADMKLFVSGLGGKHELESSPDDSIRSVKQKLEPLAKLSAAEMKLLVKGKAPADDVKLSTLGLADGAKLMLMRSAAGAKTTAAPAKPSALVAPGAPAWLIAGAEVDYDGPDGIKMAIIKAVHTDDPQGGLYCTIQLDGGERQTPADRLRLRGSAAATIAAASSSSAVDVSDATPTVAGEGPIKLTVSQGRRQLTLHCDGATKVSALKQLLAPLTSAEAVTMRLLSKGKEAADSMSVEELFGTSTTSGRLMLLFKERHHREKDGAAAVASCSELLEGLRTKVAKVKHKLSKRLVTGAEATTALGEVEEELAAIAQDLANAAPNESSEAATTREKHLAECAEISELLSQARADETRSQLMADLGR